MGIVPNFEDSDFRVEEEYGIQSRDSLVKNSDSLVKDCVMCRLYKQKPEKCQEELEKTRGMYFCISKIINPQLQNLSLNLRI